MLFWIIAAFTTAAATLALLGPLLRVGAAGETVAPASHDVEVYSDQLEEVDRDLTDGLIDATQAEVARAEISRRLIAASRRSEIEGSELTGRARGRLSRVTTVAMVVFIPALALGSYLGLGSPGIGQLPLSARINEDLGSTDVGDLIARVERHLAATPNDGGGWDVLAPIYMRAGRFDEAIDAYRKAIGILGPSSVRQAGLGEALVTAADGVVTENARLAFQSARELDPEDPRPSFFLAVSLAQEGKTGDALAAFTALAARAPQDASWLDAVNQQISELKAAQNSQPPLALGDLTQADIAAAAQLSPKDRTEMIVGMVEGLEARLKGEPDNIDGWLRLIRSKAALGDPAGAQAALDQAYAIFPDGSPRETALAGLAGELGLKTSMLGGVAIPNGGAPSAPATGTARNAQPFTVPDAGTAPGNPSVADVQAAAALAPQDRMEMIRGMVASLDARLSEEPDNIDGWLRLIRSYTVLGDADAAKSALERARTQFSNEGAARTALDTLAADLSLSR